MTAAERCWYAISPDGSPVCCGLGRKGPCVEEVGYLFVGTISGPDVEHFACAEHLVEFRRARVVAMARTYVPEASR